LVDIKPQATQLNVRIMKYLIDLDGTILDGRNANKDSVQFINELKTPSFSYTDQQSGCKGLYKIASEIPGSAGQGAFRFSPSPQRCLGIWDCPPLD